ncbi:MAG: FAD-dependent thymidylate synthase [Elusimicrobia bacterium]|nr:FAD-dependent thymidylate synthase [Elusimicrobiota bacterium]
MSITARIIKDSLSKDRIRLTTFVLRYPRFIHSEFMTHRMFSRNAASSRAIPIKKTLELVKNDPAMPIYWGRNKSGMQAEEELSESEIEQCKKEWLLARDAAIVHVERLLELGLHKQISNRILESWIHMETICTATEFANFYNLRLDSAAQPEIKTLAEVMLKAHNESIPTYLEWGRWHLPFVTEEESKEFDIELLRKFSVARCARVSYLNHEGTIDHEKDIKLHDMLLQNKHMSCFEHQAASYIKNIPSNFIGWSQYRKFIEGENRTIFKGLK